MAQNDLLLEDIFQHFQWYITVIPNDLFNERDLDPGNQHKIVGWIDQLKIIHSSFFQINHKLSFLAAAASSGDSVCCRPDGAD